MGEVKLGVVKQHKAEKPQGYACQICRASREICERCQSAKYVMRVAATPVAPKARRGRPRATLSAYR